MKIKLSWFFFIPVLIAVLGLKIMQSLYKTQGSVLFDLTDINYAYTAAIIVGVLVLICVFLNIIDKKTSNVYLHKKNVFSGIFAILTAVAIAAQCANSIVNSMRNNDLPIMTVVDIILSVLAAISFITIALSQFTEKNHTKGMAFLALTPSIWASLRIISAFWGYRSYSVDSTDMTDLVVYVLLALYLFANANILVVIPSGNSVKLSFVYGLPCAAIALGYCIKDITDIVIGNVKIDFTYHIVTLLFALLAFYILSNLIEITKHGKTITENAYLFDDDSSDITEIEDMMSDDKFDIVREPVTVNVVQDYKEETFDNEIDDIIRDIPKEKDEHNESVIKPLGTRKNSNAYDERMSEIDDLISQIESDK